MPCQADFAEEVGKHECRKTVSALCLSWLKAIFSFIAIITFFKNLKHKEIYQTKPTNIGTQWIDFQLNRKKKPKGSFSIRKSMLFENKGRSEYFSQAVAFLIEREKSFSHRELPFWGTNSNVEVAVTCSQAVHTYLIPHPTPCRMKALPRSSNHGHGTRPRGPSLPPPVYCGLQRWTSVLQEVLRACLQTLATEDR